jgi:HPt (histidine-containing phosphotransfer) domain-containing protein
VANTDIAKGGDRSADDSVMDHLPDTGGTPPIHSSYECDPELRDLVIHFVDELDQRVETIRSAFLSEDAAALQRISHQLKGAAGGYGFDSIGDSAARLEYDLLTDEAMISDLTERVEDLINNCRAAVRPADS